MNPNPNLIDWLSNHGDTRKGRALKVGCGYGDDVHALAQHGFDTLGFDIAPTAIDCCRKRFGDPSEHFEVADVLCPPAAWRAAFDFVLESYTLQVLPQELRWHAIKNIAEFVAPGGRLLLIARGRERDEESGQMPWPLIREEVLSFQDHSLRLIEFDDFFDNESPPVRRFRASFQRALRID